MDLLWFSFDMIGTIAFAISGALIGVVKNLDIFGMMILAMATAIGGGIVRDLLVGRLPPYSLQYPEYIVIIIVVSLLIFALYRTHSHRHVMGRWSRRSYIFADTLGLASFTVTGASVGYIYAPNLPIFVVLLGMITAIGGGIIRDILAQRLPSVLKEEVYALPSIIGGALYYILIQQTTPILSTYAAFLVVLTIRLLAVYHNWNLPKAR